jgi:predicted DNA-binding protein (UPF0251 family)
MTDYWTVAESVCTPDQLAVLRLRDQKAMGTRQIALALGLSRTAVRDRLDAADRKISLGVDENGRATVPAETSARR